MGKGLKSEYELLELTELNPYEKNARTHSKKQLEKLANSISEFGFMNPILIDENNLILAGHGRYEAAKIAKVKSVPVVRHTHLSESAKRAYILADNRISDDAGWDKELLSIELSELEDLDFDLSSIGFNDLELDKLLAIDFSEGAEESIASNNVDPQSKIEPNTIFELQHGHKIYCGPKVSAADQKHIHTIIQKWQKMTKTKAINITTGLPYEG